MSSKLKFMKYGVPFFVLVLGGPLCLKEFQQVKFDYRKTQPIKREELREMGIKVRDAKDVTMESVYETTKDVNIDNWENKRGPRPWEEDNKLYQEALQRAEALRTKA